MATIKPFKALQYNTHFLDEILNLVCPAYDIIKNDEINIYAGNSPYNIINLEKPMGINCYDKAAKTLHKWQISHVLTKEKHDCVYIYEEQFEINGIVKKVSGIICLVKIEKFRNKIIIPHENTLEKDKCDRFELLKATHCNFSPIFSLFNDHDDKLTNIISAQSISTPFVKFTDSKNVTHSLWKVCDVNCIKDICDNFKNKKIYIADGHHRYETALAFKNYATNNLNISKNGTSGYVMMFLVDVNSPDLTILPTHRLIKSGSVINSINIVQQCEKNFHIKKLDISEIKSNLSKSQKLGNHCIGLYFGKDYYFQLERKNIHDASLDVDILQNLILKPIFNISTTNPSLQNKIEYKTDLNATITSVNEKKYSCACILNPASLEQIIDRAANFEKMPQKSTYFYPKPITGIVFNKIII